MLFIITTVSITFARKRQFRISLARCVDCQFMCIFLSSTDNILFIFHYASKTKCISKTNFKLPLLTSQQEEGLIIPIRLMGLLQTKQIQTSQF